VTEGARPRCVGQTRSGRPCPRRGDGEGGLCILHDPGRETERAAYLAALGTAGRRAQTQRATEAVPVAAKLGTVANIRAALERALGAVERSGGEACTRAGVVARLASVALEALKVGEIEREVAELRELVRQVLPGGVAMGLRSELARMRTALGARLEAVRPVDVVIECEGDESGDACGRCGPPRATCCGPRTPVAGRPAVQLLWRTVPGSLPSSDPEAA
jgi:hypothetical protein